MCGSGTGGSPRNRDLVIPFLEIDDIPNPTCSELAEWAAPLPENSETCKTIQDHAHFCGCPSSSGNPLNHCSLCEDFATPTNADVNTPFDDTCDELDTFLRFLPVQQCSSDRVTQIRRTDVFCGCPGAKADCYMCSDYTTDLLHPDRVIPWVVDSFAAGPPDINPTCQELADWYTFYDSGDEELLQFCEEIQSHNKYCACQSNSNNNPVDVCGLCLDGSAPAYGDRIIPDLGGMTCGELELYINYVPGQDCFEDRVTQDLQLFAFLCGCSGTTSPCPMCPDGTIDMTNEDAIIPFLGLGDDNDNPTCFELAAIGATRILGDDTCAYVKAQANYCGCKSSTIVGPVNDCFFCPTEDDPATGSMVWPTGDDPANGDMVTPSGDTCDELAEYISYMPADQCITDRLGILQGSDFLCGCPEATTTCPICDDGSFDISKPDRYIPVLTLPNGITDPTCQDVIEFLAIGDEDIDEETCTTMKRYGGYCGCPFTPPKNVCSFCPNDGSVADPDLVVSELFTCADLDDYIAHLDSSSSSGDDCFGDCSGGDACSGDEVERVQAFAYTCGCTGTEPACTLCPDGSEPAKSDHVLPDGVSCKEYARRVESLPDAVCVVEEDRIARIAATCGCPGAEFPQCSIRENADLCTVALLASSTSSAGNNEKCECYAFCDDEFVKCESASGGILHSDECSGTPISGCNMAGAIDRVEEGGPAGQSAGSPQRTMPARSWTPFIMLVVYYFII